MTHYKLIVITALFAALSLRSEAASNHEAITTAQIAAAIWNTGLKVSADQVTVLTDVMAKTSAPALKVESMEPWDGHGLRVRLDCVNSDECLPFVVAVRRNQKNEPQKASAPSESPTSQRSHVDTPKTNFVVRAGSPAVLMLDGGHVHIQLAVVCLENGSVGQTIRVAGKGHAQTYMAEICNDGLLRGRL
jgi:hypothetical protein